MAYDPSKTSSDDLIASFAAEKEKGGRFSLALIDDTADDEAAAAKPADTSNDFVAPPGAPPAPDFGSASGAPPAPAGAASGGDFELSLEPTAE